MAIQTYRRIIIKDRLLLNGCMVIASEKDYAPLPVLLDAIEAPFHYKSLTTLIDGGYTNSSRGIYLKKLQYLDKINRVAVTNDISSGEVIVKWDDHNPDNIYGVIPEGVGRVQKKQYYRLQSPLWNF